MGVCDARSIPLIGYWDGPGQTIYGAVLTHHGRGRLPRLRDTRRRSARDETDVRRLPPSGGRAGARLGQSCGTPVAGASRPRWLSVVQPTLGRESMVEPARLKAMTTGDEGDGCGGSPRLPRQGAGAGHSRSAWTRPQTSASRAPCCGHRTPHRSLEAAKRTLRASVDWIQRLERIGLPYCRAHAENRKVPWLRVVH